MTDIPYKSRIQAVQNLSSQISDTVTRAAKFYQTGDIIAVRTLMIEYAILSYKLVDELRRDLDESINFDE